MQMILTENRPLTKEVWLMKLAGDTSAIRRPGQFVQLQLPGLYLRRPISVCDWNKEELTLVYKVVGKGTAQMSGMRPGERLDVLSGLGNGFDVAACGEKPMLVGGGVGLPPMYGLCKALLAAGKKPTVAVGFNSADQIFLRQEFEDLGVSFKIATMDGSVGVRGLVTALLPEIEFDSLCACGPIPMLKALHSATDVPAQYSLEERMGCGFGACVGCTVKMASGTKQVCKDGPVFRREEVLW